MTSPKEAGCFITTFHRIAELEVELSKSLLVIGFIFSVFAAIPTYGFSLLVFFALKYIIDQSHVEKIKSAALLSKDADANGVPLEYASRSAIITFFNRYGSTKNGYQFHTNPIVFYAGYVRVVDSGEFVAVVFRTKSGLVVSSFSPGFEFDSDLVSLIGKKEFIDSIVSSFKTGETRASVAA